MKKSFLAVCLFALLSACAHVNSVSVTSIPANRSQPVSASASRFIFLAFNFDNDYVDGLVENLRSKCPNGKISGILTKDETIMYVPLFLFKKQVTASGYCEPMKATAAAKTTLKHNAQTASSATEMDGASL